MKLVLIPAGEFMMGSPDTEKDRSSDEGPLHRVRITKPFYLGQYEVTQAEYQQVMVENPSYFSPSGSGKDNVSGQDTSRFPVEEVSWDNAVEFCKRLSQKEGKTYRLPTEAEWEYAARAGSSGRFCFGDSEEQLGEYGWYDKNAEKKPHPVGQKRPNPWGLYDMHGNVWEWCLDWYGEKYYAESASNDPTGGSDRMFRVLRGGGWDSYAGDCRSAYRYGGSPDDRYFNLGFRVSRVAE